MKQILLTCGSSHEFSCGGHIRLDMRSGYRQGNDARYGAPTAGHQRTRYANEPDNNTEVLRTSDKACLLQ